MDASAPRAYQFDGFRVELIRRQVLTSDGVALALSSRAYEALVYLIENRTRIVAKDDLMAAVWPRLVVEENNLNQAISSLRRALGDQRDAPRYIITIAGRGYRFVGDVTVELDGAGRAAVGASEPTPLNVEPVPVVPERDAVAPLGDVSPTARTVSRRWVIAGLATVAAAGAGWSLWQQGSKSRAVTKSIAVLPFQPLVEDAGNQALEFGMADTLIGRLSELPNVVVAPFSSVRTYTNHTQDPLAAGRALGVTAVLESHIQARPDRIRITARLLDVASGTALWSGQFDEHEVDIFAVQDALAQQVVEALQVELSPDSRRRLRKHDTENIEAWRLYLAGRFNWGVRNEDGFRRAIASYEAALALDPNFALAAAGLADAWAVMAVFSMVPPDEAFPRARVAAERAVELDRQLAEAQATLGHVMVQGDRDWKGGERQYRRALALKPTYAQAVMWLANNHCFQGRMHEALDKAQLAQSLEPVSVIYAANVGMLQYFMRDYAAARDRLTGLVDAAPQYPLARRYLARVMIMQGEAANALALLKGHEAEFAPGGLPDLGRALAADRQIEAAKREVARLEALGQQGFGVGYDIAMIYAALGEREPALAALERGVEDDSQPMGFLNVDPGLDLIRDDPRFRAVSQKVGLG